MGKCGKQGPPYRLAPCTATFVNATWYNDASCTGAVNSTEQYDLNKCVTQGKKESVQAVCT